jgi:hypothetical protein
MLLREEVVGRGPPGLRGPTEGDTREEKIDVSTGHILQTVESQGSGIKAETIEAKRNDRRLMWRY